MRSGGMRCDGGGEAGVQAYTKWLRSVLFSVAAGRGADTARPAVSPCPGRWMNARIFWVQGTTAVVQSCSSSAVVSSVSRAHGGRKSGAVATAIALPACSLSADEARMSHKAACDAPIAVVTRAKRPRLPTIRYLPSTGTESPMRSAPTASKTMCCGSPFCCHASRR